MDLDVSINPWLVSSFEEFHFYCCPECDKRTKELGQLYDHAVQVHQLAKDTLTKSEVQIEAEESIKDQTEFASGDESSADLKNQNCAVYLEDPNQDKDPLATKVSEITGAGQIEIEIKEELKIEYECPNKKHKKMCKSLPDTQDSHQIEDESEPLNKKQRRSQNEDTRVQKFVQCVMKFFVGHDQPKSLNHTKILILSSLIRFMSVEYAQSLSNILLS